MSIPRIAALTTVTLPARRLIHQLLEARAITPHTAQRLHTETLADDRTLRELLGLGVIREATPGAYYVDLSVLETVDRQNHRSLVVLGLAALLIVLIGAVVWLLNGRLSSSCLTSPSSWRRA